MSVRPVSGELCCRRTAVSSPLLDVAVCLSQQRVGQSLTLPKTPAQAVGDVVLFVARPVEDHFDAAAVTREVSHRRYPRGRASGAPSRKRRRRALVAA